MGIKNLSQFLKKREVYETLHISNLKYMRVGIDTPMFLYKFKGTSKPNTYEWLSQFINFVTFLRKHDIHPVFLFEGKAPPEKAPAQEERRQQRQKMTDRTNGLEKDLQTYISTGEISPLLLEIKAKTTNKSLLARRTLTLSGKNMIDVASIQEEIDRRKRYDISISQEDIADLKKLFTLMGVSYIQSIGEAETDCISLYCNKTIDYIVAEDTDVLAYCDDSDQDKLSDLKVIIDFNVHNLTYTRIDKQKVLDVLTLTHESFRDFCIMCGTDYNKNMFRVGVETSYKLIVKHGTIENIPLDTSILNHKRGRKIFEAKENLKLNDWVKWCRIPSDTFTDELESFVFMYNLKNINISRVLKALSEADIELDEVE